MSNVFPNRNVVGTIICYRCSKPFPCTVFLHPLDDFGANCPFDFLDYEIRIHEYYSIVAY